MTFEQSQSELHPDTKHDPEYQEGAKPSGVRAKPIVPPIESGPVTVRSGEGLGQLPEEEEEPLPSFELPPEEEALFAKAPKSGVRPIGKEISGVAAQEAEKEELEYAQRENLPPYGPSVIEEEEGREEAA